MKYGASSLKHGFKKVLFFDYDRDVIEIYDHKRRQDLEIAYNLEEGYPTYVLRDVLLGAFSGIPENSFANVELDFSELDVGERIVLTPFDPNFARVSPNIAVSAQIPKLTIGNPNKGDAVDGSMAFPEFYSARKT
jgi:hypothetical protein